VARSRDLLLACSLAALACEVATPLPAAPASAAMMAPAETKRERAKKRDKNEKQQKRERDEPRPSQPTGSPLPPCPPDNVLTWRSFGAGFLLTWCTGCHASGLPDAERQGAPTGVDFDTYAAYKPLERLVYERAVLEAHTAATNPAAASPMPPAGVVPEADRRRLAQWIACGSPLPPGQ
jgi:hypothetical protein